jgi:PAS domain S-box-containing protein
VRACPIGAIRVQDGQAQVHGGRCISCGLCVRECPQGAKVIRDSIGEVREMIARGDAVAASVDATFAAGYGGWRAARLPAALRLLGFAAVAETAEGAAAVAAAYGAEGVQGIASACPAVVSYIEKYRPELTGLLLPIASPMVAHARMLKKRLGSHVRVVHIGPCAARKAERQRPGAEAVDAVLTFDELETWLSEDGIRLSTCPESGFEGAGDPGAARLVGVSGALLHAAGVRGAVGKGDALAVSGVRDVMALLDAPASDWPYGLVEAWFCRGGCAGGPCIPEGVDAFAAGRDMAAYAEGALPLPGAIEAPPLGMAFSPTPISPPEVSEARIREILEQTGKAEPAEQLNCGACGYDSCRDHAIAIARRMAEPGMCVSFARRSAERRADHIIEASPNGIVVTDSELHIVHMNARFLRMFGASANAIGQPVSEVVDAEGFAHLRAGAKGTQETIRARNGLRYQELIFALRGGQEFAGIYVDISGHTLDARQIDLIKGQSLKHARNLLEHQIRFSQEMAHFLGRSTAQTEELVKRLMDMYAEDAPE